ncbi:MAG: NAD-dependent epimerase/dehydratase family protein, partial [Gemmatimonadota bacterium]
MKIAITGATGFIGEALVRRLQGSGHVVLRIGRARNHGRGPDVVWDAVSTVDAAALEGVDAVVHLAGETIAQRWTGAAKRAIRDSRVQGTTLLARTLAGLSRKPSVLVSMSAIGIYGDRGDEVL